MLSSEVELIAGSKLSATCLGSGIWTSLAFCLAVFPGNGPDSVVRDVATGSENRVQLDATWPHDALSAASLSLKARLDSVNRRARSSDCSLSRAGRIPVESSGLRSPRSSSSPAPCSSANWTECGQNWLFIESRSRNQSTVVASIEPNLIFIEAIGIFRLPILSDTWVGGYKIAESYVVPSDAVTAGDFTLFAEVEVVAWSVWIRSHARKGNILPEVGIIYNKGDGLDKGY